ncbi:cutinase family protein [Mycolicibacterium neoaurum]|uniref:Cutinase n=1 Tax=Mycolicibacterium neoaurum TaxID=1795 RepID=A0AAV2WK13_MYCNE|nr:cutinase family protein [Mycolicibacterium neoaurum]TLH61510.1 cutinase family protein [Mycolicibacterium neoaurum]CDQ44485.1 cutinase [Mycolicibacterium neoaurum]
MTSALFERVRSRRIHHLAVTVVLLWVVAISPLVAAPAAAAPPACPDIEIVFARGTFEAPGIGATGQAFVDALTPLLGGASVDVYPVNYPASLDFQAAANGITDASNRIQYIANTCPATKIVLGGYSQGAAVAGYTTFDAVPAGLTLPPGLAGPMPPTVAPHVAAVALFGTPDNWFLDLVDRNAPPITVGPLYAAKTIQLCAPGDPVCAPGGLDRAAHSAYKSNGMALQAADFVAKAVARTPSSD